MLVSFLYSYAVRKHVSVFCSRVSHCCAVSWCLCHWKEHCNPSLTCVSPQVLSAGEEDESLTDWSLPMVPMEVLLSVLANPSLACVSLPRSYLQVRRAGHWWLKPSDGPQHGGCFSSSSLAAEDAGQADDLFQQCLILSYFSLCSQDSGGRELQLSWKSD